MTHADATTSVKVLKLSSGWRLVDFGELREYRDLFFFLILRDIKILYAQTVLGFSWAILNPLLQILIYSLVFGRVANVPTDGIPYVLFVSVAIVPWTYIAESTTEASQSLVVGHQMLGKIYFPRLLFPLTPVLAKLVDFTLALVIIGIAMVYFSVRPTWQMLYLPLFVLMLISIPAGLGMWLSSLAIRFRDVKFAIRFAIRMLMYTAPIVYSASSIPARLRFVYSLNPIVGVIEGLRASLLGMPMPWQYIWPGMITGTFFLLTGLMYFRRTERVFADVI